MGHAPVLFSFNPSEQAQLGGLHALDARLDLGQPVQQPILAARALKSRLQRPGAGAGAKIPVAIHGLVPGRQPREPLVQPRMEILPLARALEITVDELLSGELGRQGPVTEPNGEPPVQHSAQEPGWFALHWYWLGLIPVAWGCYMLLNLLVGLVSVGLFIR